ncbi:3D domain-containing protein [Paenibacillus silvisoli]|uniref:3D domain-containing protein n=1 Tax=Paenibacillus silvisoli TaxID=3110539 RepID=UPI0028060FC1|nr:3D domain-containing protein [Paenibacillus silvisoli]
MIKTLWKKSAVIAALGFAIVANAGSVSADAATYQAKEGDTFWMLSKHFEVSLELMLKANPNIDPNNIYEGLSIVIPAEAAVKQSKTAKAAAKAATTEKTALKAEKTEKAAKKAQPAKQAAQKPAKTQKKAAPKAEKASVKSMKMKSVDRNDEVVTASGKSYDYSDVVQVKASAYTAHPSENGWGAVDYYGNPLKLGTIAVDPNVIPMGSKVYITGYDHDGLPVGGMMAVATDQGSAIKGDRIDIFVPQSQEQARTFGYQYVKVFILE